MIQSGDKLYERYFAALHARDAADADAHDRVALALRLAASGDAKRLAALLRANGDLLDCAWSVHRFTPLIAAVLCDQLPVLELLLARGADASRRCTIEHDDNAVLVGGVEMWFSALELAAALGRFACARALLRAGVDPCAQPDARPDDELDLLGMNEYNSAKPALVVAVQAARFCLSRWRWQSDDDERSARVAFVRELLATVDRDCLSCADRVYNRSLLFFALKEVESARPERLPHCDAARLELEQFDVETREVTDPLVCAILDANPRISINDVFAAAQFGDAGLMNVLIDRLPPEERNLECHPQGEYVIEQTVVEALLQAGVEPRFCRAQVLLVLLHRGAKVTENALVLALANSRHISFEVLLRRADKRVDLADILRRAYAVSVAQYWDKACFGILAMQISHGVVQLAVDWYAVIGSPRRFPDPAKSKYNARAFLLVNAFVKHANTAHLHEALLSQTGIDFEVTKDDVWSRMRKIKPSLLHADIVGMALVFWTLPPYVLLQIWSTLPPMHIVPDKYALAVIGSVRKSILKIKH